MKNLFKAAAVVATVMGFMCVQRGRGAPQTTPSSPTDDINAFREQAMPAWSGNLERTTEWRACARVIDPWHPETRICLSKSYGGHVSADYVAAQGAKLSDQFLKLREAFPSVALSALVSRLSITTYAISRPSRAIDQLAAELEHLEVSFDLPNVMSMDQPRYELELQTQYDSGLRLVLVNAPPNHPIVAWIRHATEVLATASRGR